MRVIAFFIWLATLIATLVAGSWELTLMVILLPALLGLILLVNDWCLAPIRRSQSDLDKIYEEVYQELYWQHPDPTIPDPLKEEDEELRRIITSTHQNGSKNGKAR